MRVIKFRGKNITTEEWVYGYFKKNKYGDCYIENEDGLATVVDPNTVGQYVLTNFEGKEIYEGDYVQDMGTIWMVYFDDLDLSGISLKLVKRGDGDTDCSEVEWLEMYKLIGNDWDGYEVCEEEE